MKNLILLMMVVAVMVACNDRPEEAPAESTKNVFKTIKVERYSVRDGNADSIALSSYIAKEFDSEGRETKSIYYSTDNSIMMQFVNQYEGNNKTRVDWVNGQEEMVKYVKNTFNEDDRLIRSESFSPQDEFQSGFIHQWKEGGKVEEKGPIEEGEAFRPNAIYRYNDQAEFELLREFDANDSLYAVVRWDYIRNDEFNNWIERHMITNDTLNQVEKRIIEYRKE